MIGGVAGQGLHLLLPDRQVLRQHHRRGTVGTGFRISLSGR